MIRPIFGGLALGVVIAVSFVTPVRSQEEPGQSESGVSAEKRSDPIYTTIPDQYRRTDVDALIEIHNAEDVTEVRRQLIELVFGQSLLPTQVRPQTFSENITDPDYADLERLRSIDSLTLTMTQEIQSVMYLFHAEAPNGRLIIYHQGHDGDFLLGKATIQGLLRHGYDVIALAMPLLGKNNRPTVNIDGVGFIYLKNHEWMRFLDRPLQFFMYPILAAVDYGLAMDRYRDISLVGLSGGGWSVTLYAALDPRVRHTYQVGGTMPFFLRSPVPDVYDGHVGDFEQNYPLLIQTANYLELYVLGAAGENRKEVQIINQFDSVAAHGVKYQTYEKVVAEQVDAISLGGSFKVYLDSENPEHTISSTSLECILATLDATDNAGHEE